MDVDTEKVRALVHAAMDAMVDVCETQDVSANEVFSAYFSMARNAILTAKDMGATEKMLKSVVEILWQECGSEETVQ